MTTGATPSLPGQSWGWNVTAGRYVDLDTGRFISRDYVFDQVDRALETLALEGEDFLKGAIRQQMPLELVQRVLMREIKDGYIASYVGGRGGAAQMTARDWGILGRMLRDKYEYLRKFIDFIGNATEDDERYILKRYIAYFNNMVVAYWKGDQEAAIVAGKTEMKRTLNSSKPCRDCPGYAGRWEKIGDLPLPTEQCECIYHCLCTVEYR